MNKLVSSLAGLLLAVSAQASIQITYQIDGGAVVTCFSATTSVSCPLVAGPVFDISGLSADSNSPGTPSVSFEESTTLHIANLTTKSHEILIGVVSTDFAAPTTPPDIILNSHIGGTVVIGNAANLLHFQSCVDSGNTLAVCPAGSFKSTVGSPPITAALAFSSDQFSTITSLAPPYALDEILDLTLGGGADAAHRGRLNFAASTTLSQVVPEPASILLLGTALFGFGAILRRRLL